MINKLVHNFVEYSKITAYRSNFRFLNLKKKITVLDIGAGSCLLRKIFSNTIKTYVAFEPQYYSEQKMYLHDSDILIHDYFRSDSADNNHYDYIFALTVLDEVESKSSFLQAIKMNAGQDTRIFIAVRNLDFPLRKNGYVTNSSGDLIQDLSIDEWRRLFSDYKIISERTFVRPLLNENIITTVKLIIIRILDWVLPTNKSYMIMFELMVSND